MSEPLQFVKGIHYGDYVQSCENITVRCLAEEVYQFQIEKYNNSYTKVLKSWEPIVITLDSDLSHIDPEILEQFYSQMYYEGESGTDKGLAAKRSKVRELIFYYWQDFKNSTEGKNFELEKITFIQQIKKKLISLRLSKNIGEMYDCAVMIDKLIDDFKIEQNVKIRQITFKELIKTLNEKEEMTISDCFELRVGGNDQYSNIRKFDDLCFMVRQIMSEEEFQQTLSMIRHGVPQSAQKYTDRALRWIARGLKAEHAIQKVNFDLRQYPD